MPYFMLTSYVTNVLYFDFEESKIDCETTFCVMQSMLYKCIERNEWDAAAYVIYWMDDARWDVPADLREQIEARMSQKVH